MATIFHQDVIVGMSQRTGGAVIQLFLVAIKYIAHRILSLIPKKPGKTSSRDSSVQHTSQPFCYPKML